jgi:phosphopentomutase
VDTAALVAACGADFGFVHDGDADRLVMVNGAGRVLPDSVVSIIALRALARSHGTVILSENTSSAVEEDAVRMGLRVVRSRIGKTFAEIRKEGAFFASEPSKVVNPDWGMWEDGMYCAALIADSVSGDQKLLELLNSEPSWHYRQVNLHVSLDFSKLIRRAEQEFGKFRIAEVRQLDGLKLIFKDRSWIMFRASGTEPKVRIYCESRDPIRLGELLDAGKRLLEELSVERARVI